MDENLNQYKTENDRNKGDISVNPIEIVDVKKVDSVQSESTPQQKRLAFAIAGSIDSVDQKKLQAIVTLLQKMTGDTSIEIIDIQEGSIRLILNGSEQGLERILSLYESGELNSLFETFSGVFIEGLEHSEEVESQLKALIEDYEEKLKEKDEEVKSVYREGIQQLLEMARISNSPQQQSPIISVESSGSKSISRENDFSRQMTHNSKTGNVTMQQEYTYQQSGNFGIGHMSGGENKNGAKVSGVINEPNQRPLAEAANEIQNLLKQIEHNNPDATFEQKKTFVELGISPTIKQRAIHAIKAGGQAALEEILDNSYLNVGMAIIEGWQEG